MDNAILLTKLNNYENKDFELYKYYINATSFNFINETIEFNVCMQSLKELIEKQYDFEWLAENAKIFEVSRRDFRSLCDDVCILLGNRIEELCKYTKVPIYTKPSKFEDYCPFANEIMVVYGNFNNYVTIEGKHYIIIDTKLESTPYYNIYCNIIEL